MADQETMPGQHGNMDTVPADNYGTGLTDEALVLIETKHLNRLVRERGLAKEQADELKRKRRTLKNRGYAAQCRFKDKTKDEELDEELQVMNIVETALDRAMKEQRDEFARLRTGNAVREHALGLHHHQESADQQPPQHAAVELEELKQLRARCIGQLTTATTHHKRQQGAAGKNLTPALENAALKRLIAMEAAMGRAVLEAIGALQAGGDDDAEAAADDPLDSLRLENLVLGHVLDWDLKGRAVIAAVESAMRQKQAELAQLLEEEAVSRLVIEATTREYSRLRADYEYAMSRAPSAAAAAEKREEEAAAAALNRLCAQTPSVRECPVCCDQMGTRGGGEPVSKRNVGPSAMPANHHQLVLNSREMEMEMDD